MKEDLTQEETKIFSEFFAREFNRFQQRMRQRFPQDKYFQTYMFSVAIQGLKMLRRSEVEPGAPLQFCESILKNMEEYEQKNEAAFVTDK